MLLPIWLPCFDHRSRKIAKLSRGWVCGLCHQNSTLVCLDEGLEPHDSVSPSRNGVFLEEYLPPYVAGTGDDQGSTQPCFQGTSTVPGSPGPAVDVLWSQDACTSNHIAPSAGPPLVHVLLHALDMCLQSERVSRHLYQWQVSFVSQTAFSVGQSRE